MAARRAIPTPVCSSTTSRAIRARFSLIYTPTSQWEIEPRLTLVDPRLDDLLPLDFPSTNPDARGYAKLDLFATYKATENLTVFARAENLTDAVYQEVFGFGTAGRSFYGGITYSW